MNNEGKTSKLVNTFYRQCVCRLLFYCQQSMFWGLYDLSSWDTNVTPLRSLGSSSICPQQRGHLLPACLHNICSSLRKHNQTVTLHLDLFIITSRFSCYLIAHRSATVFQIIVLWTCTRQTGMVDFTAVSTICWFTYSFTLGPTQSVCKLHTCLEYMDLHRKCWKIHIV